MIDAVLCELEGTLIDSAGQRRRALQRAFVGEGIALPDALYDEHCSGKSTELAVETALHALGMAEDPVLPALLTLAGRHHFRNEISRGVLLAPGAAEFLEAARASSRVALVARAARDDVELLLSIAGLANAFECATCADDVRTAGAASSFHETALARLGRRRAVNRGRALALESGMDGARAALAAGVRCVIVGAEPCDDRGGVAAVRSLAGKTPASLEALLGPVEECAA